MSNSKTFLIYSLNVGMSLSSMVFSYQMNKNIKIHTVHITVSLPNAKQWQMGYFSDLMMIIR